MLTSLDEFKFYQSFRVSVEEADNLRFLVDSLDPNSESEFLDDAQLVDISVTGIGFSTKEKISVGTPISFTIQFKRFHLDLEGKVVRAFTHNSEETERIIYGVEIEHDDGIKKFLSAFIQSFSMERLRDCLINSATQERYCNSHEGIEMISLILSLFKDITKFGEQKDFLKSILEEVSYVLNAQRASVFLINPETNELEASVALGADTDLLKFDYRQGVAGCVFTTGVPLNLDITKDQSRFSDEFDQKTGFQTKSILCNPIHNKDDKVVGVVEVLNKKNETRFSVDDEKTMKVIAMILSSVFHNYNPLTEGSQIRRFSTPFDRDYAMVGNSKFISALRSAVIKLKDLDSPVLIEGEIGVGKTQYARILHHEGNRGLNKFQTINCQNKSSDVLEYEIFGSEKTTGKLEECLKGTLLFQEIGSMPVQTQQALLQALREGKVADTDKTMNLRIMATSTVSIQELVEKGEFNSDLYDILSTAFVKIEPLRNRMDDLNLLIEYFSKVVCKSKGLLEKRFSKESLKKLQNYDWPGNIAELKKCVERAILYSPKSHVITKIDEMATPLLSKEGAAGRMFKDIPHAADSALTLKDRVALIERQIILTEVKKNKGNKSKAAKLMGISREALRKKLLASDEVLKKIDETEKQYQTSDDKIAA